MLLKFAKLWIKLFITNITTNILSKILIHFKIITTPTTKQNLVVKLLKNVIIEFVTVTLWISNSISNISKHFY